MDKAETPAGSLRHRASVARTVQQQGVWELYVFQIG